MHRHRLVRADTTLASSADDVHSGVGELARDRASELGPFAGQLTPAVFHHLHRYAATRFGQIAYVERGSGPAAVSSPRRRAQFHRYALGFEPNPMLQIERALRRFAAPVRMVWGTGDFLIRLHAAG